MIYSRKMLFELRVVRLHPCCVSNKEGLHTAPFYSLPTQQFDNLSVHPSCPMPIQSTLILILQSHAGKDLENNMQLNMICAYFYVKKKIDDSPLACGARRRKLTEAAPADSPTIVTFSGSPPKYLMNLLTHRRPSI